MTINQNKGNKMKHTITIAAILMATTATADGPGAPRYDPPVIAPPQSTWTGPYAGVSAGAARSETTRDETETCEREAESGHYFNKCLVPSEHTADLPETSWQKCAKSDYDACVIGKRGDDMDMVWLNSDPLTYVIGTITEQLEQGTIGAHAGYRWDMGRAVIGLEGGATYLTDTDATLGTVEATAGYDMGRLLPYVSAGAAYDGDEWGNAFGIGAEYAMTDRVAIGIKASRIDIDGDVTDGLAARVSFQF